MSHKTATLRNFFWITLVSLILVAVARPVVIEAKSGNLFKQQSYKASTENRLFDHQRHGSTVAPVRVGTFDQLSSTSFISYQSGETVSRYSELLGFLGFASTSSLVARPVSVVAPSFNQGQPGTVSIEMVSQGDENAIGFSLNFDPSKLTYVSAVRGVDATATTLNVNTIPLGLGRLGLAIAFQSGGVFAAGNRQLVVVTFNVAAAATGSTNIGFGDSPIVREVADVDANVLDATYNPATIPINNPPNPLPALASVSPNFATAGGSDMVLSVSGSNFVNTSVVKFGGSDLLTTFVSSTQLTAQLPAAAIATAGNSTVTIVSPAPGGGTSGPLGFSINNPLPSIAGLAPTSATTGGPGLTLTVNGSGFVNGSVVTFGGSNRATTFVSSTQLTAQIIAGDLATGGVFAITVQNAAPGGGASSGAGFTVNNPAPTISGLTPSTATAGGNSFTLTVDGNNFVAGAIVRINGGDRITSFIGATHLNVQLSAADIANAGILAVTVLNPTPGGGITAPSNFTVNNPVATLTSISPTSASAGGGTMTLTVNGSGFVNSSVVRFNGSNRATTFVNNAQLTADLNSTDTQAIGTFGVTVFNPTPGGGISGSLNFDVHPAPPVASSISPSISLAGGPDFTLTVNGSNFADASVVKFNGSDRLTTFVSSSQLNAAITAADIATAGTGSITVFTPAPGGGSSSPLNLAINNAVPTIVNLSPASAVASGPSFTLTVNGNNFVNGSVVKLSGSDRPTTFVSSFQLNAQIAAADIQTAGTLSVSVFSPAPGGGTSTLSFTVNNPAPILNSLSPANAFVGGAAFTLTVNGSNFVNGSVVKWNGNDRVTNFISNSQLTAQIPAADIQATGSASITVFNSAPGGGTSTVGALSINNPVPTLGSLAPNSVLINGADFTLTVNGTGFVSGAVVKFNGNDRLTSFNSSTQLTIPITATDLLTAGVFPVIVTNPAPGGGASGTLNLTVNNPVPTINNISAITAVAGDAPFTLTVNGSNFLNGSVVRFEGSDRTTNFVNGTQVTAQISAADLQNAGTFHITVFNPVPGGGSSNALDFTIIGPNPVPVVSGLLPATVTSGGSGFTLTVNGSNFINGSVVKLNGNERATTFSASTLLTAQITLDDIATAGVFSITVFNPAPVGGTSNTANLNVHNPSATISTLSPASKIAGDAAFTLTVNGNNFISGAVVKFNGIDRATNFVSSTQLTIEIIQADVATAATIPVVVVNPSPGGGASSAVNFMVNNPAPTITNLSSVSAFAGDPSFTLTVTGSNFVNGSVVKWNGSNRVTNFISNTELTAQIPAADIQSAGVASITVFNSSPGGGTSSSVELTVTNPMPVLSSVSPTTATAGSASFTLSLTGTHFVNVSVVRLNGIDRLTTFVDATHLTVQISAADISTAGTILVAVFNPLPGGGTSDSLSLVIDPAPPSARALRIVGVTGLPGANVVVPIELVSHGDENALGFSLLFDPAQMTFVSAEVEPDALGASLIVNSTAAVGHVGIAESLPAGTTFSAGVRQVLTVTFAVSSTTNESSTDLTFDEFPIFKEVVNINAVPLPTAFSSAVITIAHEGKWDLSSLRFILNAGEAIVCKTIRRFMALLDIANLGSEYQRADCAPAATLGDGRLSVADWTQSGRYAAHLDPITFAGGPTAPSTQPSPAAVERVDAEMPASVVSLVSEQVLAGQRRSVSIDLDAQGNENALGFSLMFNPSILKFISAELGQEASEGMLQINAVNSSKGRLGIALALPTERAFGPGRHRVAILTFEAQAEVETATALEFSDLPIDREVVDVRATPIKAAFVNDKVEDKNPIDDPQYFVQQQYLDFLGRKPDAGGLDYWTEQITRCGSDPGCLRTRRLGVSAAFFMEQEFQQTGFFIYRLYKGVLGRQPSYREFMAERSNPIDPANLEVGKQALIQSWLGRSEFQARYPSTLSDAKFVDALLTTVREGSGVDLSSERQSLIDNLSSHDRARVLRLVVENPALVKAEYNPAFVLSEYFGYLRRDPDQGGYEFWLDVLNNRERNNYHSVVCAFVTSREYQKRFGSVVSHTNAECGP